ncbi:unnamed protein product [Brachionus calyciflorus]|uniref:Uncharacterized protein n=1 Tax=Brachionus calyciflorus TaxID=104777 RepID=A0A813UP43_9BILA|nr:unnamed protein product [Brachionus calyciflorus]
MEKLIEKYCNEKDELKKQEILNSLPENQKFEFMTKAFEYQTSRVNKITEFEQKFEDESKQFLAKIVNETEKLSLSGSNIIIRAFEICLRFLNKELRSWLEYSLTEVFGKEKGKFLGNIVHFTVESMLRIGVGTLRFFFKAVNNPEFWLAIKSIAEEEWNKNQEKGTWSQISATSKKIAGSFAYTFWLCMTKSLEEDGIHLSEDNRNKLKKAVDSKIENSIDQSQPKSLLNSNRNLFYVISFYIKNL